MLGLEGALRAVDNQPIGWPTGAQAKYEAQLRAALDPPQTGDPLVTPPVYGSSQTGAALQSAPVWEGELNLDPRTEQRHRQAHRWCNGIRRRSSPRRGTSLERSGRPISYCGRRNSRGRSRPRSIERHLARVAGDGTWLQITAPLHSRVKWRWRGSRRRCADTSWQAGFRRAHCRRPCERLRVRAQ